MKNPSLKETAKRALALLLFVAFGVCVSGSAAPKAIALSERRTS